MGVSLCFIIFFLTNIVVLQQIKCLDMGYHLLPLSLLNAINQMKPLGLFLLLECFPSFYSALFFLFCLFFSRSLFLSLLFMFLVRGGWEWWEEVNRHAYPTGSWNLFASQVASCFLTRHFDCVTCMDHILSGQKLAIYINVF